MNSRKISNGDGRTKVILWAQWLGSDLVLYIYNENAHIGAVAVAEYDSNTLRVSTSVMTRLGHKDNVIAQKAAYVISKATKKPVCVIVGIHVHNITQEEISKTLENANSLVEELIQSDFISEVI